jgi:cell division inhibitor SepF
VSWWHNLRGRLGLEDAWDEAYDEDDDTFYDADADDDEWGGRPRYETPHEGTGGVRRLDRDYESSSQRSRAASLRSVPAGPATVTPVAPQLKMHIVEPKSFSEAQSIADKLKQGTPVIINMTMTKPELAKRFIDFASGLTYGVDGGLQKVSDKVFMLTPHNMDVSAVDRQRLRDKGLFTIE